MKITTKRLSIKPYAKEDMESVISLLQNDAIKETFIVPDLENHEQYQLMFEKMKNDSESNQHYAGGIYLNNHLIGLILDTEITVSTVEMGYVIEPSYQNCGYATEALQGVISYLFQNGVEEVITGAFSENIPSIKVMEKNKMKRIEKQDEFEYRGKIRHCIYYSIKNDVLNISEIEKRTS